MQWICRFAIACLCFLPTVICAQDKKVTSDFDNKAQKILVEHFQKYSALEFFSGITLSVSIPKNEIKNYYIGRIAHEPDSPNISSNTLFQIGSITKSFTAAIMLQLEKEKKLSLDSTIGNLLPKYNAWSAIQIKKLLNMTSGLPNYSDTPLWNADAYKNPARKWSDEELISYAYPTLPFSPPLKTGYFYTNTGYLLAALIIEKITQNSFENEIVKRLFKPIGLQNTFYVKADPSRLAHGYNYNQYDNPRLVAKDMFTNDLSWAAAAGGIISNSEDVIKWVNALFISDKILDAEQKKKLTTLISINTGEAIKETTDDDPKAFGLGVAQAYDKDIGRFWYYEGETLGFRALFLYTPCNGIIISSIFNSAVNEENDHAGALMKQVYALALDQKPELVCRK